jgi:hypothetical protein
MPMKLKTLDKEKNSACFVHGYFKRCSVVFMPDESLSRIREDIVVP